MKLTYLVGEPAAGKTTAMRAMLATIPGAGDVLDLGGGFRVTVYRRADVAVLGTYLGHPFDGTDRLSMAVGLRAREWIATRPHPTVLGEGDRLASKPFFLTAAEAGYDVDVVLLDAHGAAENRRAARPAQANPSWVAGRVTKVRNLPVTRTVDSTRPPEDLARTILGGAAWMPEPGSWEGGWS